jgi:hypothetical protein
LNQQTQALRYATLSLWIIWAWLVMTLCHELGHVVAGMLGGARLTQFEIRPWHLPHSLFVGDSHPLLTLWAGPVLGAVLPALVALSVRRPAIAFVAWFCVVANASYLVFGYFGGDGELDSTRMIRAGARPIEVLFPAIIALAVGYWGFRRACIGLMTGKTEAVSRRGLCISAAALAAAIVLQGVAGSLIASRL